jgi:hypothetical protein
MYKRRKDDLSLHGCGVRIGPFGVRAFARRAALAAKLARVAPSAPEQIEARAADSASQFAARARLALVRARAERVGKDAKFVSRRAGWANAIAALVQACATDAGAGASAAIGARRAKARVVHSVDTAAE